MFAKYCLTLICLLDIVNVKHIFIYNDSPILINN